MEKLGSITLYNKEDVRKLLHLGNGKTLDLFKSNDFPSIKAGHKYLITEEKLMEYLNKRRVI